MALVIETTTRTTDISTLDWLDDNKTLSNDSLAHADDFNNDVNDPYDIYYGMPDILRRYDVFHYYMHGYLTLTIICFGTIGNIISMVVLTRKHMINSINMILTALAFADMMVLLTYLVKIKYHSNLKFMSYTEVTYSLAVFNLFVRNSFILFHTVSVWLTVVVAIWRVMGVCYSLQTTELRSLPRAKIAVFCTYAACVIVCIPEYLHYKIHIYEKRDGSEGYITGDTEMYQANQELFDNIDDWGFNIILYLIPCIPLTVFTIMLIKKIYSSKNKREELHIRSNKRNLTDNRLTKILIIILLVFLFSKVPPGIMYVLDFGLGYKIVHQLHFVFAGTINSLILVNSATNFFVFFFMSSQFRAGVHAMFCKKFSKCSTSKS